MAATESSLERQKAELTATLALSRRALAEELDQVAESFDVTSQFRRSFRERSWQWLAVALAAGAITGVALLPKKKSKKGAAGLLETSKKHSIAGTVAKFALQNAFLMAQPVLARIAKERIEGWVKASLHKY